MHSLCHLACWQMLQNTEQFNTLLLYIATFIILLELELLTLLTNLHTIYI